MKCKLIRPRGYCHGVKRALNLLDSLENAYVYKDIVHNESVLEKYRKKGIVFVSSIDEIPPDAKVVFSAHGVSKMIKDSVKGQVFDGTCSVLKAIHKRIQACKGPIIYLGNDEAHEEVKAILDYGGILFVKSGEVDVKKIQDYVRGRPASFFTQTTLNIQKAQDDIKMIEKGAKLLTGPTICYATKERQDALLANSGLDHVIVVGSQMSSNSQRLFELASAHNKAASLVQPKDELKLDDAKNIALTSGASTPEEDVQKIVARVVQLGYEIEETF